MTRSQIARLISAMNYNNNLCNVDIFISNVPNGELYDMLIDISKEKGMEFIEFECYMMVDKNDLDKTLEEFKGKNTIYYIDGIDSLDEDIQNEFLSKISQIKQNKPEYSRSMFIYGINDYTKFKVDSHFTLHGITCKLEKSE